MAAASVSYPVINADFQDHRYQALPRPSFDRFQSILRAENDVKFFNVLRPDQQEFFEQKLQQALRETKAQKDKWKTFLAQFEETEGRPCEYVKALTDNQYSVKAFVKSAKNWRGSTEEQLKTINADIKRYVEKNLENVEKQCGQVKQSILIEPKFLHKDDIKVLKENPMLNDALSFNLSVSMASQLVYNAWCRQASFRKKLKVQEMLALNIYQANQQMATQIETLSEKGSRAVKNSLQKQSDNFCEVLVPNPNKGGYPIDLPNIDMAMFGTRPERSKQASVADTDESDDARSFLDSDNEESDDDDDDDGQRPKSSGEWNLKGFPTSFIESYSHIGGPSGPLRKVLGPEEDRRSLSVVENKLKRLQESAEQDKRNFDPNSQLDFLKRLKRGLRSDIGDCDQVYQAFCLHPNDKEVIEAPPAQTDFRKGTRLTIKPDIVVEKDPSGRLISKRILGWIPMGKAWGRDAFQLVLKSQRPGFSQPQAELVAASQFKGQREAFKKNGGQELQLKGIENLVGVGPGDIAIGWIAPGRRTSNEDFIRRPRTIWCIQYGDKEGCFWRSTIMRAFGPQMTLQEEIHLRKAGAYSKPPQSIDEMKRDAKRGWKMGLSDEWEAVISESSEDEDFITSEGSSDEGEDGSKSDEDPQDDSESTL